MLGTVAKKKPTETTRLFAELPSALVEAFNELADENKRTLKGELELALEAHLAKHGKWPPADESD
jgi:hypothetical protein